MSMHDDFLKILAYATAQAGSVRKLADATELDPSILVRWKGGQRSPTLDSIQGLLDYLGFGWCEALAIAQGFGGSVEHSSDTPDRSEDGIVARLRQEVERLRTERDKAIGQVELLKEMVGSERQESAPAPAKKVASPSCSGSRTG